MNAGDPVDLTNCDREPIHIPGSIQGFGTMLVCDPRSFVLLFASQNAAGLVPGGRAPAPGSDLGEIIGQEAAHEIRNAMARTNAPGLASIVLGLRLPGVAGAFDVKAHTHEGRAFVEIEPSLDNGQSAQQALDLTQNLIRRIGLEHDVDGIAATGAKLVRAMLGYDRVMVYRFLHNGAGRVIAEAKAASLGSFMGQHFPASDIPYQARRLYLINPIRMIADTRYVPVPLAPALAPGAAPVDMSHAQLRSVSPIHCEYLQNMGVEASLSISVIVDGELWGLISCHHDTPKVTPMPLRIGAELFGQYFSLQMAVAARRTAMVAANLARERLDRIVASLSGDGAVVRSLVDHLGDLAGLVECDGAALWVDGVWSTFGNAPDRDVAQGVIEIAKAQAPRSIWTTQELRLHQPANHSRIAGALAIPLSVTLGDYLVLFRNEEAHTVEWAGEPVKTLVSSPHGERLTPRGSFETWREEVKGRSTPWTDADLSVAEAIRTYLRDIILRQNEATAEERARTEQRRRILNAELNHRVKNIIALVKSIATQTGAGAGSVAEYSSALEGRLRALAFAHDQSLSGSGGGDLATLAEVEASLHRYAGMPERVSARGPRVRLDDRAFGVLALVVHEMMTNAAKYGALSSPDGRLDISWSLTAAGDCEIAWRESGGPPVERPSRDGFGTKLIRSTIEYDLRGSVEMAYRPAGVRARLTIPAVHVSLGEAAPSQPRPPAAAGGELASGSMLIVEDQGLIAMDAEETLRRLGVKDVRLAASAEDAIHQLATFHPDAAVLDFNLATGTSEAVADILLARAIPFVFTTGYSDDSVIPERFRHIPMVRKPINGSSLALQLATAREALRERQGRRAAAEEGGNAETTA